MYKYKLNGQMVLMIYPYLQKVGTYVHTSLSIMDKRTPRIQDPGPLTTSQARFLGAAVVPVPPNVSTRFEAALGATTYIALLLMDDDDKDDDGFYSASLKPDS